MSSAANLALRCKSSGVLQCSHYWCASRNGGNVSAAWAGQQRHTAQITATATGTEVMPGHTQDSFCIPYDFEKPDLVLYTVRIEM